MLVGGAVEEPPRATPPASPVLGACYIVAAGATDDWAGKSQCVSAWTSGGWRFVAPVEGMTLYERTGGTFACFRNGAWDVGTLTATSLLIDGQQVVGARAAAIDSPAGGTVVDLEARSAISAILSAMRQHGLIAT